jgi:hypothetical protein
MTTPRPPRNRFGTTTFVIIVLGALLAVFPATAVLGLLLLLLALVPAVIAYVLTRTGRATDRRRSLASLVLAPVFLIVAAGVVGANAPATPLTVNESPAAVGDTSSLAASPTSTPGAPVAPVVDTPVLDTPVLDAPAFDGPAVEATGTTRVPQRALAAAAPTAKATASRSVATKAPAARASASKTSAPAKSSATKKPSSSCDTSTHYVNSSGNCVLRPTASPPAPGGASAKCKDGTLSFSQHRSGTCSGHGGVAQWL